MYVCKACCQNLTKTNNTKISDKSQIITFTNMVVKMMNCLISLTQSLTTAPQPYPVLQMNTTRLRQQKIWKEVLLLKITGGNVKVRKKKTDT